MNDNEKGAWSLTAGSHSTRRFPTATPVTKSWPRPSTTAAGWPRWSPTPPRASPPSRTSPSSAPRYDATAVVCDGDEIHACPYTDFPLIEIDADGVRSVTPNPVKRCTGLALSGADLAFLAQRRANGGFRWEIRRALREGGAVTETGREHLLLPIGRRPSGRACGKIGRGGTLWLHQNGDPRRWYRYEMDT
ncbi:hypothetical protein [Spongiactinospora sp. TRM90649]|uniref:hypothetical protein n=1 Tax=Spongiactinospora sp. TRM90649 TaxID=3031114 RepID=UPI0023F73B3D|nr:hypothetical protein [Spongiactinospora sp. TRM90649]